MKRKHKLIGIGILGSVLIAGVAWVIWGNTALELNTYRIQSAKLPKEFAGFRIAHISDLHNAQIGADNERLLKMLKEAQPDIIAITGDLIDSRRTDVEVALDFAERAMEIAPCYFVAGNHEARVVEYEQLKTGLNDLGVIVLENESVDLRIGDAAISLIGVEDPSFRTDYATGDSEGVVRTALEECVNQDVFTVLLSHRPELIDVYSEMGVDLVLTGHAHGGQVRLPIAGGVIAPNQGFFPVYDAGLFTSGNTNMIVSRGVGNSLMPLRVNNRPEVVIIELE